eukprot:8588601-Prorocentrum_lima.AAC.1
MDAKRRRGQSGTATPMDTTSPLGPDVAQALQLAIHTLLSKTSALSSPSTHVNPGTTCGDSLPGAPDKTGPVQGVSQTQTNALVHTGAQDDMWSEY